MKKWMPLILIAGLVIAGATIASITLTSDGIAFKDYDLNDDGCFSNEDVGLVSYIVSRYGTVQITPPNVSKYDLNLDAVVNDTDSVQIFDDWMNAEPNYAINFVPANPITINGTTFHLLYIPESELDKFVSWFNNYTPIEKHIWSAAGYPNESYPKPTPYFYVCADFATDAYWIANKNFLDGNNMIEDDEYVFIGFGAGWNFWAGHAYNLILIGPDPLDLDNWRIFEPQAGRIISWDEANTTYYRYYMPEHTQIFFEYYDSYGNEKALMIAPKWNPNDASVEIWPFHMSTIQSISICNDDKAGVELDHLAGVYCGSQSSSEDIPPEIYEQVNYFYEHLSPPFPEN